MSVHNVLLLHNIHIKSRFPEILNYSFVFSNFFTVSTHGEKSGSTRSYPTCNKPVLPRGILNNTTWPLHVAVYKYAVINIPMYYVVESKGRGPLAYSDFVHLSDHNRFLSP